MMDIESFLNTRRMQKVSDKNTKTRNLCLLLSVFLSLMIIAAIYFISDYSNIYRIVVNGNYYLSDEDIIKRCDISTDDKYVLTIPYLLEKKMKEEPLIESCDVRLMDNRLVSIEVVEKKQIGYSFENNQIVLIGENNERIALDNNNMYLINRLPYIEGFSNEDLVLIEKNMTECDKKLINEISEMHYYPELRYQNVELIMRDGNYIFTSPYGLKILNKYYDIESSYQSIGKSCYYFEDISGNAYTSACPWQQEEEKQQTDPQQQEEDYDEDNDE